MHVAPQAFVSADYFQKIAHGIPQVDVYRKIVSGGEVELPFQGGFLFIGIFASFVIVQSDLSDCDDVPASGAGGVGAAASVEIFKHLVPFLLPAAIDRAWVQPDHRPRHLREPVRDGEHVLPFAGVDVGKKHHSDAFVQGPADVAVFLAPERFVTYVTMCVNVVH